MTRSTHLKRETQAIVRTMQFAINAMEQVKESFMATADLLESDVYLHKVAGIQEGIYFLIRLKEIKEKQL